MNSLAARWIKLAPQQRLYQSPIPIIGLTGGIATGKSTVAQALMAQGVVVISADELIKDIYSLVATQQWIASHAATAIQNGQIDFPKLRQMVFTDAQLKQKLEQFLYPQLASAYQNHLAKLTVKPSWVVYDVPLLFERKLESQVDVTVVVYAPRTIQKKRLMLRDGSSESLAESILNQQNDIEEKKKRADIVVDNSIDGQSFDFPKLWTTLTNN